MNIRPCRMIAHRGHPSRFPENTIEGLLHAIESGAKWVEVDVQLTGDLHPVLFHDQTLSRAAGDGRPLFDLTWSELQTVEASFSDRLGSDGPKASFSALSELVQLLNQYGDVCAFVELKRESAQQFGVDDFLQRALSDLAALENRNSLAAIISLAWEICQRAQMAGCPIGWVLPNWSEAAREDAVKLAPEFLFVDHKRLPADGQLWAGDWQWVAYTVDDAQRCQELADMGFDFIETDAIGQFLGTDR